MTRLPWELPAWAALPVAVLVTVLLARLARDRFPVGSAPDPVRLRGAPPVGGAGILAGLLAVGGEGPWWALLGAFVLGTLDDLHDLRPRTKVLGQLLLGGLLLIDLAGDPAAAGPGWAWPAQLVGDGAWGARALLLVPLGCLVACNAWNTFDHADGTAGGLALIALWPVAPARAALAGFLPWNLLRGPGAWPRAYLGDAGSHLLGVLVLARPAAWPFLLLPLADLLRLAVVRLRAGSRPWVGDRRHVTHGLLRRGWPAPVAALVVLAPALALALGPGGTPGRVGLALGLLVACWALGRAPRTDGR